MKRTLLVASIATALAISSASAGYKNTLPFQINATQRWAAGAFADIRSDPNPEARLGCGSFLFPGYAVVQCSGYDGSQTAYCYSTDPEMIDAVHGMVSDVYIRIEWNPSGQCTYLGVSRSSEYAPKQP